MNYTLSRQSGSIIETGKFKNNSLGVTTLESILEFSNKNDISRSVDRIIVNNKLYDYFTFPEYVNSSGEELIVYGPKIFIKHITKIIKELVLNNKHGLYEYMRGDGQDVDFWWDLGNDFYVFFGEEKKRLIEIVQDYLIGNSHYDENIDILIDYYYVANPDLKDEIKEQFQGKRKQLIKLSDGTWIEK